VWEAVFACFAAFAVCGAGHRNGNGNGNGNRNGSGYR